MTKEKSRPSLTKYLNPEAFNRLMMLIATILKHPGVGYLNKPERPERTHNALEEVRQYLLQVAEEQKISIAKCSTNTIHKDLAFLRTYGILGDFMYRWGYYLGTGAMSEAEMAVALNALHSQSEYQRDPQVRLVYQKLTKRLRGVDSQKNLFYPVRAQLNRSIVETDPMEVRACVNGQRNLFDCLQVVENAILYGQKIELYRIANPFADQVHNRFQVYPLQLLHYDIAWYLIHENVDGGHLAISRLDRLKDECKFIEAKGRGIGAQQTSLKLAHELLENGWGLYLGNSDEQRKELIGQLELIEVKVRFYPKVMAFITEGSLRHPSQTLEIGPKDKATGRAQYIDYCVKLPRRSIREFNFWIYRFMGNVQVLSPEWLVEEHKITATQQYALYSKDNGS
jgi:hypothetical protein